MVDNYPGEQRSWWKVVLTGISAIVFGIAAIALPANIMFGRILDVIFGKAKPLSGGMTAVAALLALVALVAIDGLVNLFGTAVFAELKNYIGLRRLRMRFVREQFYLAATAQNLKRLVRFLSCKPTPQIATA